MEQQKYSNIINILKEQYLDSKNKSFLHKKTSEYYNTVYSILSIINIILLSVITISKIITDIYTNTNVDDIVFTILMVFSTMLTGIIHFLNYSELSVLHENKSIGYTAIYNSIERQITVPTENIQEYYSWVSKKYDTLLLQVPNIPKYILDKYSKKINTNLTEVSIQLNEIQPNEISLQQISKEEQYQIDRWIANE